MFCPKCGNKLEDNALFCDSCGASLKDCGNSPNENSARAGVSTENGAAPGGKGPKKPFLKRLCSPAGISITAIIVAVAVAAALLVGPAVRMIKRTFMPAENYAGDVLGDKAEDLISGLVPEKDPTENKRVEGELSLIVGDKGSEFLSSLVTGSSNDIVKELIGALGSLSIKYDVSQNDNAALTILSLCAKGESVITAKMTVDSDNGVVYIALPELSDKAAYIDIASIFEMSRSDGADSEAGNTIPSVFDILTDDEFTDLLTRADSTLAKSISKYISAGFKGLGDGEKSREELKVNGVSEKCTMLEFKIDEKAIRGALEAILEEVEDDDDMLSLLDEIEDYLVKKGISDEGEADPRKQLLEMIDNMNGDLDDMEEELGKELKDTDIYVRFYISNDESIAGIEAEISTDGNSMEYAFHNLEDGHDVATEIYGREDGEDVFSFSGKGKKSGGLIDGEYTLSVVGTELCTLEVTDFDADELAKSGALNGTFTITPSEELIDSIADRPVGSAFSGSFLSSMLSGLSLRISVNSDSDKSEFEAAIMSGGDKLFGIGLSSTVSEAEEISIPKKDFSYDISDEDEIKEWLSDADPQSLAEDLLDKLDLSEDVLKIISKAFSSSSKTFGSAF